MDDRVLVTGATGFIAQHCIAQLLDAGFRVRGTARTAASRNDTAAAVEPHLSADGAARLADLELVAADLSSDDGWDDAMADCRYVLHVASPVPAEPPADESEVIGPARDGVRNVLRAAAGAGVERVVLTSSISAIICGVPRDRVFDERDWSDVDGPNIGAYDKSKTLAERAAWNLIGELGDDAPELVVINPGLVLGPPLNGRSTTSVEVIRKIVDREVPAIPNFGFAVVDVRDVAAAHIRAMVEPSAAGQRFIVAGENRSMRELATILDRHLGPRGHRIPTRKLPSWAARLAARRDRTLRLALQNLDVAQSIDATKARGVLGFTPRPIDDTVCDTADSIIELRA